MIVDLHSHTRSSDGELDAAALLRLAAERQVDLFSITDHDTVKAYAGLAASELPPSLTLVPGIELSTTWEKTGIHVLGLGVCWQGDAMREAEQFQTRARAIRAETIAERLEKAGLRDALAGARRHAGEAALARPHFARYMVEAGFCKSIEQAFRKFLGAGKPGDIRQEWASLAQVVGWIRDSGGVAVLAHPHHYSLTRSKLLRLLDDFVAIGGQGIEVLSGKQDADTTARMRDLAIEKNLLASLGSDFHGGNGYGCTPGMHPALPKACKPVWSAF